MIKICIPHYAGLDPRTEDSLRILGDGYDVQRCQGTYISEARNVMLNQRGTSAVWQKPIGEYSHFLFVDADIGFTMDNINALLAHDVPIVAGAYESRHDGDYITGGGFDSVGNVTFLGKEASGTRSVEWVGAGFLLVKAEVFCELPYPWFRHEWVRTVLGGVEHQVQTGEDVGFCISAKKQGFDILLDCDCVVQHFLNPSGKADSMAQGLQKQNLDIRDWTLGMLKIVSDLNDGIHFVSQEFTQSSIALAQANAKVQEQVKRIAVLENMAGQIEETVIAPAPTPVAEEVVSGDTAE